MAKNKYYRVKKDTFLWDKGAILYSSEDHTGYVAVNDMWDACELGGEYISSRIVENCPEWFERVYKVDGLTKVVYQTKEKAREMFENSFKDK